MRNVKPLYIELLWLLLFPFSLLAGFKYDLSVCAIFQNEDRFLKEWIDYHRSVGVKHFWLYNNNSTDNFRDVLKPYIKSGVVELIEWPSNQEENDFTHFSYTVQPGAYNDALDRSIGLTKWLAIIDTDEFIVPVCSKKIINVLEKYFSNASGVCINWQCYGTSNLKVIEKDELMIEMLLYKLPSNHPKNLYYKSIVQPLDIKKCLNPHFCEYLPGHWHVNTNDEKIGNLNNGIFLDKLRINHYWTRDEYFLHHVKVPRHEKWGGKKEVILEMANEMNQEFDDCILKFIPKLKN